MSEIKLERKVRVRMGDLPKPLIAFTENGIECPDPEMFMAWLAGMQDKIKRLEAENGGLRARIGHASTSIIGC